VGLIYKGDREATARAPYFISLGFKQLVVGLRTSSVDYALSYNLFNAGVDPKEWHHVAASFVSRWAWWPTGNSTRPAACKLLTRVGRTRPGSRTGPRSRRISIRDSS